MPFSRGKQGKENRTYKLNKVGAKIATYHKLAIIHHVDTFEIVKYGELEEMKQYIDEKYYCHPQYHHRTFQYMIQFSDCWLPEALERMIEKGDTKFTSELDYAGTEHLFVDEDAGHIGMIYHGFSIAGDPPMDYWKDVEKRWQAVRDKTNNLQDDAAEKRRQRSLKAAETMRKKREAEALKK